MTSLTPQGEEGRGGEGEGAGDGQGGGGARGTPYGTGRGRARARGEGQDQDQKLVLGFLRQASDVRVGARVKEEREWFHMTPKSGPMVQKPGARDKDWKLHNSKRKICTETRREPPGANPC